jgi:hypothetical protein
MKKIDEITVPVIQFDEFRDKFKQALTEWLEGNPANCILSNGIPKMDKDDLQPFIEWSFLVIHPDLPSHYFIQTDNAFWLVSLGDCICWGSNCTNTL